MERDRLPVEVRGCEQLAEMLGGLSPAATSADPLADRSMLLTTLVYLSRKCWYSNR